VTAADHPLERWAAVERFVPYGGLAIGLVLSMVVRDADWPGRTVTVAVTVAAAVWVWAGRRLPGWAYFAGWTGLSAALVLCSPWYGFSAFVGYLFALEVLSGRWRFAGIVVTASITSVSQIGGLPPATGTGVLVWFIVWVVNSALAGGFTYYGWLTDEQNTARKQVIEELGEANERLAAAVAENAALQERLVASARAAGVQDERARLAREIHDTIAQDLAGVVAQLQAAGQAADRPAERDRHVRTAAELARAGLAEARRSVQALRPEPLEDARLPDALAAVAARWSELTGVPAAVTTTGTARTLHPEVEVALLRTGQEALANVGKHAAASRVGVTLSYMEDVVTLDVRDDGSGFDPAGLPAGAADGSGFGLTVMRQRVSRVAGHLEVESAPGEGTAVSATVPAIPA
jgi:signal transduction histidine kinase